MKIILIKDVKGIGKAFDVKEVKDGYARNFLLLKGLAEAATKEAVQRLERQKKIRETEHQKLVEELKIGAKNLEGLELKFKMKTGRRARLSVQ